jgi:hypothetical protein
MARRIEVNKPRGASEDEAQRLLARILPPSWIVTTNIKEHMFPGRRKPELDCILLAPLGLFVLDFKNFGGVITPMLNQAWGGVDESSANPLEQIKDNLFPLKDLFEQQDGRLKDLWIESLIVLTNESVELDWRSSDLHADARMHVALLGEVETKVRQIAATKRMALDPDLASKILAALKPTSLPNGLFAGSDWAGASTVSDSATACPRSSKNARANAQASFEPSSYDMEVTIEETAAPGPSSPEEYGHVGPELGLPPEQQLAQAHLEFDCTYTDRGKLAEAYHKAVYGLSAQEREEFDDDLYRVLFELEKGELTTVINAEMKVCPPVENE